MTDLAVIAPVELTLDMKCSQQHAFDTFTACIADWWPFASHSVSGETTKGAVFEASAGGRIYEIAKDGTQHLWGTVLACEAPGFLRYTWHPGGTPEIHSEVEIKFLKTPSGCRMELVHRGFENFGERGQLIRDQYQPGWEFVAGDCFKNAAEG